MFPRALCPYSLLVVMVAGWLAACGELPRPFHDEANPLAQPEEVIDVAVVPLSGVPVPMARRVAAAVAYHLGRIDIPATDGVATGARYRLTGTVTDDAVAPEVAIVHWTLFDADGNAVGVHDQGISGSVAEWEGGDSNLIGQVAVDAATALARVIADAEVGIAPPPAGSLAVEAVRGAPGDGNRALMQAIRRALVSNGMPVVEAGQPSAYRLMGDVDVAPPQAGRQAVRIVWRVVAVDGTQVGRAVGRAAQENLVAAGSLDGAWGDAAIAISAAAVSGIADILKRDNGG